MATKVTRWKSLLPNWVQHSFLPIAGGSRRSRFLYRLMDQGVEGRQARDLQRRVPCAARGGLPARFAEIRIRSGGRGVRVAMTKPDIILIGGRAYCWQAICELRRQQLEAWKAAQPQQLALFELKEDYRPAAERTAAGRYAEPSLFDRALRQDRTG